MGFWGKQAVLLGPGKQAALLGPAGAWQDVQGVWKESGCMYAQREGRIEHSCMCSRAWEHPSEPLPCGGHAEGKYLQARTHRKV